MADDGTEGKALLTRPGAGGRRRRSGGGRPTIADVATRAGVGAITVSRALRDPHLVSEALRRDIDAAVRELNYIPNANARALARTRSDVIGVLVPSLSQVVFTDVLGGIYDGVDGTALQVQFANTRYDPEHEERTVEVLLRHKPAGMIISGIHQTPQTRRMLEAAGCPVIQIMDLTDDPIDQIIGFSHVEAGRSLTEHLISEGYRRIAFLKGWTSRRGLGRYVGYRQALAAAQIEEPLLANMLYEATPIDLIGHFGVMAGQPATKSASAELGRRLFREALTIDPAIDAVFCNNDIMALGALFECIERGIRVPEDMGIAGFNDHDYMRATEPSLTSVRTYRYQNGYDAIMAIRRRLAGKPAPNRVLNMGFAVMTRQSTNRSRRPLPTEDDAKPLARVPTL